MTPTPNYHLPFILDGQHRCTKVLASSPTAVIYESTTPDHNTRCATKLFRTVYQGDRGDLLREFYDLARLRHPHIVRILDSGVDANKHPYIVMEQLMGTSMSRWLERYGTMAPAAAIRLLQGPLDALAMLHRKGWTHAALEPSNLFVSDVLSSPSVTLLGVGAGILGTALATRPNRYTPPETPAQTPTAASDVYRMGVVLAEMMGGDEAFGPPSKRGVTIAPESFPEQMWVILQRATSTRPEDRYPNSDALLSALATLDLSSPELRSSTYTLSAPSAQSLFHTPVPSSFRASVTSSASHTSPFHGRPAQQRLPELHAPDDAARGTDPTLAIPSTLIRALSSASHPSPFGSLAQTPSTPPLAPSPQSLAATHNIPDELNAELLDTMRNPPSAQHPTPSQLANDSTVSIPTDLLAALSSASSTALPQLVLAPRPSVAPSPPRSTALEDRLFEDDSEDDALFVQDDLLDSPLFADLCFDDDPAQAAGTPDSLSSSSAPAGSPNISALPEARAAATTPPAPHSPDLSRLTDDRDAHPPGLIDDHDANAPHDAPHATGPRRSLLAALVCVVVLALLVLAKLNGIV